MHARSRRLAALLALSLVAAVGTPAAQASTATSSRGLLDGLGGVIGGVLGGLTGVLNGLLGTAQLAPLNQLTSSLSPGTTPSAQTLAPLTSLVSGIASNAAVPADVKTQAGSVLGILNSGSSTPLSAGSLNQITGLLGTLAMTQGLSTGQVSTLNGLVAALQSTAGTVTGGLPIIGGVAPVDGLPVGSGLVDSLTGVVGQLTGGTAPTAAILAPVTALLRQVAASLPAPLNSTVIDLADAIDQTVGPIGDDLLGPLTTLLGQIAATAGVSPAAAAQLGPLATSLARGSTGITPAKTTTAPAKTIYAAAKISKVRIDRKKGTVIVSLSCQSLTHKCASILTPLRGKSSAGKAAIAIVGAGGTLTKKLALSTAARRIMKRQTVKIVVVGTSQRGTTNKKTVTTRVPKRALAKKH